MHGNQSQPIITIKTIYLEMFKVPIFLLTKFTIQFLDFSHFSWTITVIFVVIPNNEHIGIK